MYAAQVCSSHCPLRHNDRHLYNCQGARCVSWIREVSLTLRMLCDLCKGFLLVLALAVDCNHALVSVSYCEIIF